MSRLGAITRFASGTYSVTRRASGTWLRGRLQTDAAPSTVSILASVQPISGREIHAVPEGRRADEIRVVYTATELQTEDSDGAADVISIDGENWEVFRIETWVAWGVTHYRAMVSRMGVP